MRVIVTVVLAELADLGARRHVRSSYECSVE
jgi:hypothetical protein